MKIILDKDTIEEILCNSSELAKIAAGAGMAHGWGVSLGSDDLVDGQTCCTIIGEKAGE
tara:strand:- start:593 stop:769 length:177 start_codon:yes stop_codon:yes gene_type:complete